MRAFSNIEQGRQLFSDLLEAHKEYILSSMTPIDQDVANQKTRFTKFLCWVVYGHLIDKEGICRRCGKKFKKI